MSDMNLPLTRAGGTDSYRRGVLKRRLDSQLFANLSGGNVPVNPPTETARFKLQGLEGTLKVQIAAGFQSPSGAYLDPNVVAQQIPSGTITMQLTPITRFGDGQVMAGRPVFQDPTLPVNSNNPLPMDLPFTWEFTTESDEVWIDLVCTKNISTFQLPAGYDPLYAILNATVEYNGAWWDTQAIRFSLSQVTLTNVNNIILITTAGS